MHQSIFVVERYCKFFPVVVINIITDYFIICYCIRSLLIEFHFKHMG